MGHEDFDSALLHQQKFLCVRRMARGNQRQQQQHESWKFYVEFMKLKVGIYRERENKREKIMRITRRFRLMKQEERRFFVKRLGRAFFFTIPRWVLVEILFIHHKQISCFILGPFTLHFHHIVIIDIIDKVVDNRREWHETLLEIYAYNFPYNKPCQYENGRVE